MQKINEDQPAHPKDDSLDQDHSSSGGNKNQPTPEVFKNVQKFVKLKKKEKNKQAGTTKLPSRNSDANE
jgi:hypothetical protein